jgi:hypothetical protein
MKVLIKLSVKIQDCLLMQTQGRNMVGIGQGPSQIMKTGNFETLNEAQTAV